MESHQDGGVHFHMCVLLDKIQRWSKVKKHLQETKDIVVHFSGHPGYRTAYEYVTKLDSQVLRSEGHPTLKSSRLGNLEVSDMIISNGIDSKLHFLALAKKKKTDGDSRLYEFVLKKSEKRISELVQSVWAMETAQQTLERRLMSRIDLLKMAYNDKCVCQEGHLVHFAAPKTSYAKDIEFSNDTPVFATSKSRIIFIKGSIIDGKETEMMDVRWRYFAFHHQFKASEQKTVTSCGCCFARLLLDMD
eukprot:gene21063-biopygen14630